MNAVNAQQGGTAAVIVAQWLIGDARSKLESPWARRGDGSMVLWLVMVITNVDVLNVPTLTVWLINAIERVV